MHYYIDGYNLLFRLLYAGHDFSIKRQQLIEELNEKLQFLQVNATLVFDSHYQSEPGTRSHYRHLEILYTSPGESADERIISEIQEERHLAHITVVTSDKKLAWFARRCNASTETVEQFLEWVNKRCKNKLRQEKQQAEKKTLKAVEAKKPALKPKPKGPPSPEAPAEACSDYYLTAFQSRLENLEEEKKPQSPKVSARKSRNPKKKPKIPREVCEEDKDSLSDMDRWMRIFERKLHKDNGA